MRKISRCAATGSLAVAVAWLGGCQNEAQSGSLLGAGFGALAGQAIGGNTEATLIGTGVGAMVGYVFGNEADKGAAHHASSSTTAYTHRRTRINETLHPDGTISRTGTTVTDSQERLSGYTGLDD